VSKDLDIGELNGLSKEEYKQIKNIKKLELQNIKKNPYLNLTQKQFKSYLNKCERFSKEKTKKKSPYSTCVKDVTEMIKQTLKELDNIKKELLENYEEGCEELKQTKEETSQNKLTTYYQLLEKCKQKITDVKEVLGVQPLLETIARIKEEIIVLNSELKTLKKTKPLNKEMIDRIQHRIAEKKEFIKNTEEDIKETKKEEKIRLREEMAEEKVREKEEKDRIKALEDIEDLVRDGYTMDIERVKNVLHDFNRNIERKLQDFV